MPMTGGRDNRPQLTLRTTAFIALSFGPSILRRSAGPPRHHPSQAGGRPAATTPGL